VSLKEIAEKDIVFGTVTVRAEAVNGGHAGWCLVQSGDTVCLLGTLVTVDEIAPVGDLCSPEAYILKVSYAL